MAKYRSPDGVNMLTWGDLYALYDDYATSDTPVARLLIAIMDGNYEMAEQAMKELTK